MNNNQNIIDRLAIGFSIKNVDTLRSTLCSCAFIEMMTARIEMNARIEA